ncbi:MAG: hypothetical protein V4618_12120 [Pseudomonadota bacterium]
MMISVVTPTFQQPGELVTVDKVHVAMGQEVRPGTKLFDCIVDLSASNPHDCPPQTLYRVSTRDGGWIRSLAIAPGHVVTATEPLAILSADPDAAYAQGPVRNARLAIAAILSENLW